MSPRHFVSPDWGSVWPTMRQEAHYGDRVVACFAERPASLHQLLDEALCRNPDGDALVCGDERLTYRQLLEQSARVAAGLAARGVKAGDRVALLLGNRIEFVLALFAATRLGAITVPLSVREQTPGLAYMLDHCAAVLLVHEAELAPVLPPASALPALRSRIATGGACDGAEPFEALLGHGDGAEPAAVAEEDTAAILYTSGTTGRPKGAMLTHLGLVHSSMHYQIAMGLGTEDSSIAAVPLSHVTGLVALVTTMVRAAGRLTIMPAFKAADFLRLAAREHMTHTLLVPAMYNLCLLQSDFASHDLTRWRIGAFGGAPMPLATIDTLARTVPSLTLMNCYGATETTSPTTLMPAGCHAAHSDTVGTTLGCAEVCVMDDAGREVPPGDTGELWIGGPMVVPGYWDNPRATQDSFTAGYWHSGDLGSVDAQCFVRIVDRKKDMLNRGGFKVYSVEVENALMALPGVVEAAVIGRPCPVLGERVHAVLHAPGVPHDETAVQRHCANLLADYKVPETFHWSDTPLPRNANGKLLKRALREGLLGAGG